MVLFHRLGLRFAPGDDKTGGRKKKITQVHMEEVTEAIDINE